VYQVTQLDFVCKENLQHNKQNFLTIISENIFEMLLFYCFNLRNFLKKLYRVNSKLRKPSCFEIICTNAAL